METLKSATSGVFSLVYEGQDITRDISPFVESLTYTDNLDGTESDSLDITLDDTDARWIDDWWPDDAARIVARLGYEGQRLLYCGAFEFDDLSLEGPPSTCTIKALAAGISKPIRTKRSVGYDDTTLAGVASAVAARHGLSIVGTIDAIPMARVTQYRETDLAFLRRIADEYGYAFNIRGDKLVFSSLAELRGQAPVLVITPQDVSRYTLRGKVKGVPKSAASSYHDPKSKSVIAYDMDSNGKMVASHTADTLRLHGRSESKRQAKAKCQAALDKAGSDAVTGSFALDGDIRCVSGNNIELLGWVRFDGEYRYRYPGIRFCGLGAIRAISNFVAMRCLPRSRRKSPRARRRLAHPPRRSPIPWMLRAIPCRFRRASGENC